MTQRPLASRTANGGRLYTFPDGAKHPSVTSVIAQLPKPFLVPWAAKMAAEWAMNNLVILNDLAKRDKKAAVELISGASKRSTSGSGDVGTEVHGYFECLLLGMPDADLPEVSPEAAAFLPGVRAFMEDWQPTAVLTECTIRNDEVGYAGSLDAVVRINEDVVLLDLKTGKSTYPDVSLQLAAYRFAQSLADGTPMVPVDGCAVLHVRPLGEEAGPKGYKLKPVKADAEAFHYFKLLRQLYDWDSCKGSHIGAALSPPKV